MSVHLPAGSPGSWRPGTARIWQWWCVSGCSRMATSAPNHYDPSSRLRAAEPESSLPQHGLRLPPPEIWWRTDQGLTWGEENRGQRSFSDNLIPYNKVRYKKN